MPEDDRDIEDVMKAEGSRGTSRPTHLPSWEEQRQLRQILRELLRPETDLAGFETIMRAFGILAGTERYETVLRVRRAEQREKQGRASSSQLLPSLLGGQRQEVLYQQGLQFACQGFLLNAVPSWQEALCRSNRLRKHAS